jgi:hypothetical protein
VQRATGVTSDEPLTNADELRLRTAVRGSLGAEYETAVIEEFVDSIGDRIDDRARAQVAEQLSARTARDWPQLVLALTSLTLGLSLVSAEHVGGLVGMAVTWLAIVAINLSYALRRRK